jgi:hypothetical protein
LSLLFIALQEKIAFILERKKGSPAVELGAAIAILLVFGLKDRAPQMVDQILREWQK